MKYNHKIIRVKADTNQIKNMYAKFSKIYGYIEKSERSLRKKALKLLDLQDGEIVLEIGFGRGTTSIEIAKRIGKNGEVYGIDITPEMVILAKKKVAVEGLSTRIKLQLGDARQLPYNDKLFDVVYIASTLELFDIPDLPIVLNEIKRVLKSSGRICVISIPKKGREHSIGVKLFEWSHKFFPKYSSCRPIYVEDIIKESGFIIDKTEIIGVFFPMKIVIAKI